jgi:fatty acid desaturase
MKTTAQTTFVERVGRSLGRLWRGGVRLERKARGWLVAQGLAPGVAKTALLVAKLVALGLLLYAAFWLALLVAFSVAAAWAVRGSAYDEYEEWEIVDQADHKRSVFYDPINYNDDPDPRFDDKG